MRYLARLKRHNCQMFARWRSWRVHISLNTCKFPLKSDVQVEDVHNGTIDDCSRKGFDN